MNNGQTIIQTDSGGVWLNSLAPKYGFITVTQQGQHRIGIITYVVYIFFFVSGIQGTRIVTGISGLAADHMQAGTIRLCYDIGQLGLFAVELIVATTVPHVPSEMMMSVRIYEIVWWARLVLFLLAIWLLVPGTTPVK